MSEASARAVFELLHAMKYCRIHGLNFADCVREARREFNKEVRKAALNSPLPTK